MAFVDKVLDVDSAKGVSFSQIANASDRLRNCSLSSTGNRALADNLFYVLIECQAAGLSFSGELSFNFGL